MTTPQADLWKIQNKVNAILEVLQGNSETDFSSIREILESVNINSSNICKRIVLLEDKMDLIIKLLGK